MRRTHRSAAALAGALAVCALLAGIVVGAVAGTRTRPGGPQDVRALPTSGEASGPVRTRLDGLMIEVKTGQVAAELRGAPWLYQLEGSPNYWTAARRPSLVFPSGVTYAQALTALYHSVEITGGLPSEARLGPPLPDGIVMAPETAGQGLALDLRAPWGYDPVGGAVAAPAREMPGDLSPEELDAQVAAARAAGARVPASAIIAVPDLPPCEIEGNAAC